MSITLTALQKQRRDTAANWTAANPTLLAGEIGIESDTNKIKIGDGSTAWASLAYTPWSQLSAYPIVNADIASNAEIAVSKLADGSARQLLQTAANGTDVEWTSNVDVPGTLDVTGAATFDNNVIIQGDLTVNGTETIINTQTLDVEDKNIVIGKVTTPSDVTADGGGITLKGTTDKTINWVDATDAWTFSEHVNIASGKEYRINGTKVLDATSLGSNVLITSSNITDGTIVNGDINASAAIAGTKISPDFGSQTVTTTGVISAALGAAGTPSLTFTGDLNTGIYSPGADQVAISTGGSGRLFVDSSGRVGIGGTPFYQLHATGTGAVIVASQGTTDSSFITNVNGTQGLYLHSDAALSEVNELRNLPLVFKTNATERLRITSAGLVGIGTSSPAAPLHVSGTDDILRLTATDPYLSFYNGATRTGYIRSDETNSAFNIVSENATSAMRFYTNNTVRAVIDSSGRVGIGTASPGYTLDVAGTIRSTGTLLTDLTNGDLVARELGNNSANNTIEFHIRPNSGKSGYLTFTEDSVDDRWSIGIQNGNGGLRFISGGPTSGTERARLTSSGQWLVGTSTARAKFYNTTSSAQVQLEGIATEASTSAIISNYTNAQPDGAGALVIARSGASSLGSYTAVASGNYLGEISFQGADGTEFVEGARIRAVVDGTSGANDLPTRLEFSTTADGASSPTERMRIDSTGKVFAVGVYNATTGAGANVAVDSAGHLQRSTSSIKYKTDVETLEDVYADALLQCRPVWYRSTCVVDDPKHSYWGFIAEEVAEIDPRLVHWKTTEPVVQENGSIENVACVPEPEGVAYERFVPHLLNMIKRQKEQIEAMEARLAALESA